MSSASFSIRSGDPDDLLKLGPGGDQLASGFLLLGFEDLLNLGKLTRRERVFQESSSRPSTGCVERASSRAASFVARRLWKSKGGGALVARRLPLPSSVT